jgi:hypothetical protein
MARTVIFRWDGNIEAPSGSMFVTTVCPTCGADNDVVDFASFNPLRVVGACGHEIPVEYRT